MKILLLTQDDSFYLPDNLQYLISNLPEGNTMVACVLFKASPFGKKKSFFEKAVDSFSIFGVRFFAYYGFQLVINKIGMRKNVGSVLKKHNIPIISLEKGVNHPDSIGIIKQFAPDLLISIAGNQIFKRELINLAPKGCLNLHTALLPKYRGLMPTFWVLKNNESETGVSVFFVDEGIDSGPIIVQKKVKITTQTQRELIKETKQIGMEAIIEAIKKIDSGTFELLPNDAKDMTYYSFPTAQDVKEFRRTGKKFF